jgi:hypothetical protein
VGDELVFFNIFKYDENHRIVKGYHLVGLDIIYNSYDKYDWFTRDHTRDNTNPRSSIRSVSPMFHQVWVVKAIDLNDKFNKGEEHIIYCGMETGVYGGKCQVIHKERGDIWFSNKLIYCKDFDFGSSLDDYPEECIRYEESLEEGTPTQLLFHSKRTDNE